MLPGSFVLGPSATTCNGTGSQWCHLAITIDQSSATDNVIFYVNGVAYNMNNDFDTYPIGGDLPDRGLFIGTDPPLLPEEDAGDRWPGLIDEVGIYSGILDENTIGSIVDGTCAGFFSKSAKSPKSPKGGNKNTKTPKGRRKE